MNYSQGKIYKIVDNTNDNIYIGSTCQKQLRKRLSQHVADYKKYIKNKKINCSSTEIIKNGNYDIILIEEYPCMNKMQLHKRERYHIENNKCINKSIPGRTRHEWHIDNKEYNNKLSKIWRNNNKELFTQLQKNWRNNNKDYRHKYYIDNKERELMMKRQRNKFKKDCDYLCSIDITIFQ